MVLVVTLATSMRCWKLLRVAPCQEQASAAAKNVAASLAAPLLFLVLAGPLTPAMWAQDGNLTCLLTHCSPAEAAHMVRQWVTVWLLLLEMVCWWGMFLFTASG
jgi:hypothetical protein